MSLLLQHWTLDPVLLAALVTVGAHELGLARLRSHSRSSSHLRRRRRSWFFYGGVGLLMMAIVSPLDYWASSYFWIHMIDHVITAFFVPILIVAGAPWLPLLFALPVRARRRVGRFFYLDARATFLRSITKIVRSPLFAVLSFNVAMLFWHVPAFFELSERNQFVHVWLMHGSFLVTGTLFWLQIIPSHPMKPVRGTGWQIGAILFTNAVMTFLAMSMSILTTSSWYSNYNHIPGVTLSPFADQQIGAAILWICGDFWALPTLATIIRKNIERGDSAKPVFEKWTGRGQMSVAEFRSGVIEESS